MSITASLPPETSRQDLPNVAEVLLHIFIACSLHISGIKKKETQLLWSDLVPVVCARAH